MRVLLLFPLIALPAHAEVPDIVTDIAPVQAIAAAVMGDTGTPRLLIDGQADPHHVQLRPSEARRLAEAGALVWVGPALTPWLQDARQGLAPDAPSLVLMEAPGVILREPMFGGHDHDHGHEHGDNDDAHDHEDEAHEAGDPHAWLDPMNAVAWARAIAGMLGTLDPANGAAYAANAAAFAQETEALVAELTATLAPVRDRAVIVQHDAYAHFADRFGLTVAGSIGDSDAAARGAASLIRLEAHIEAGNIACLLTEVQQPTALADRLLEGHDVARGVLDPLGADGAPGADGYARLMRQLAADWAACAGAG